MMDESRLTKAEMRLDFHDQRHDDIQASIQVLTKGIDELVKAEARRQGDKETVERIFIAIKEAQGNTTELRADFESYKITMAAKELSAYKGAVTKFLGLVGLVVASYIAGHIGGKWLG